MISKDPVTSPSNCDVLYSRPTVPIFLGNESRRVVLQVLHLPDQIGHQLHVAVPVQLETQRHCCSTPTCAVASSEVVYLCAYACTRGFYIVFAKSQTLKSEYELRPFSLVPRLVCVNWKSNVVPCVLSLRWRRCWSSRGGCWRSGRGWRTRW